MPNLEWSGIHAAIKADWKTPELLIEGSLGCGKTTVALDKEIDALLKWPGIPILLFRWTEDATRTKLKTAFEELLSIRGIPFNWDEKQKLYTFQNGSTAAVFGLKAVSQIEIFNKIRGLGVCRIMGDQVEEMERAVAGELRGRLRPDLTATMSGRVYPFQLTFVAQSEDNDFWLSKEFPTDNHIKGRKVFALSVFDNPHLPQETIDGLIRQFPPDHPKHQTMILGRRGPNIVGDPVYEGLYRKDLHWRAVSIDPTRPIWESFEFGKHNPTWLYAQGSYAGGVSVLGAIRGEGLMLDDFIGVVEQYRAQWIPPMAEILTCVAPFGSANNQQSSIAMLRQLLGVTPRWQENGNSPDVRLRTIETIAGLLGRRTVGGHEAIAVNNDEDKFLIINKDGPRPVAFVHHAFEGGFVWNDKFVSVANKELREAREDDKFANVMHCLENIVLNFSSIPPRKKTRQPSQPRQRSGGSMDWAS